MSTRTAALRATRPSPAWRVRPEASSSGAASRDRLCDASRAARVGRDRRRVSTESAAARPVDWRQLHHGARARNWRSCRRAVAGAFRCTTSLGRQPNPRCSSARPTRRGDGAVVRTSCELDPRAICMDGRGHPGHDPDPRRLSTSAAGSRRCLRGRARHGDRPAAVTIERLRDRAQELWAPRRNGCASRPRAPRCSVHPRPPSGRECLGGEGVAHRPGSADFPAGGQPPSCASVGGCATWISPGPTPRSRSSSTASCRTRPVGSSMTTERVRTISSPTDGPSSASPQTMLDVDPARTFAPIAAAVAARTHRCDTPA